MQFLLDHMVAILITAVILLIMVTNQMVTLESSIDDTSFYSAKKNTLDFANIIENDLNLTLHRYDLARAPFVWPTTAEGRTTLFSFYRDSLDIATTPTDTVRLETRYRLVLADSFNTGNQLIPLFRVDREECKTTTQGACGAWTSTGGSASLITDFDVTPLRSNKSPAANVAETQFLEMSFSYCPPFKTSSQTVAKLHWRSLLQVNPF